MFRQTTGNKPHIGGGGWLKREKHQGWNIPGVQTCAMTAVLKATTARMVVVRLGSCILVVGFVELF